MRRLLGCWTSGLFVIGQHPEQPWLDFARDLPTGTGARVGLFTTYKLATGSMFPRMRERLVGKLPAPTVQIKSRGGRLSAGDREALERFVGGD